MGCSLLFWAMRVCGVYGGFIYGGLQRLEVVILYVALYLFHTRTASNDDGFEAKSIQATVNVQFTFPMTLSPNRNIAADCMHSLRSADVHVNWSYSTVLTLPSPWNQITIYIHSTIRDFEFKTPTNMRDAYV